MVPSSTWPGFSVWVLEELGRGTIAKMEEKVAGY